MRVEWETQTLALLFISDLDYAGLGPHEAEWFGKFLDMAREAGIIDRTERRYDTRETVYRIRCAAGVLPYGADGPVGRKLLGCE